MRKILLIEDDPHMLRVLEKLLTSKGFEVVTASNGFEAIDKVQADEFALVVSDVRMPDIDGIDTLRQIGTYQPQARKLVITGYAGDDAPIRAIQLSVDDYLMKPFSSQAFLASVENALARYETEREKAAFIRQRAAESRSLLQLIAAQVGKRFSAGEARLPRILQSADRMAARLDLGTSGRDLVKRAALYHDLGYIGAAGADPLSADPEIHARHAAEIARGAGEEEIAVILERHHEDSRNLPIECRLLALVEGYENLVFEKGVPVSEALERLSSQALGNPSVASALAEASAAEERGEVVPARDDLRGAETLLHLAQVHLHLGKPAVAEAALGRLRASGKPLKDQEFEFRYALAESQLFIRQEKFLEGYAQACRALELAVSHGLGDRTRAQVLLEISLANLFHPHDALDRERLRQAEEIFARNGDWRGEARANLYLALTFLVRHESEEARACAEKCRNLVKPDFVEDWLQGEAAALRHPLAAEFHRLFRPFAPAQPGIKICSLGPFRVYREGTLIKDEEWRSKKARFVLIYLLLHAEKPVSEERLCDLFWPDSDMDRSRKTLQQTVYLLRRTLEPGLEEGSRSRYILFQADGYRFDPSAAYWWDVEEFRKHHARAEAAMASGREAEGIASLLHLQELYQGDLLEYDSAETWVEAERAALRDLFLKALLRLALHHEKENRLEAAFDLVNRVLSAEPLHEQGGLHQIRLMYRLGQRSEAIRRYHEWCGRMKRELGLSPSAELVSLYEEMIGPVS